MWRQPCNDDMVIITCAGKWKISRKYGGICGQGEGRMKRIVDKGLLLAGGLLMAGQSGRLAAPVIALLLAMTAAAYGSCVDNRRWHCVCLAGMFAVCFILPELCFSCRFFCMTVRKKGDAALVLECSGARFFLSGTDYPAALFVGGGRYADRGCDIAGVQNGQNSVSGTGDDPSSGYQHGIESGAAGKNKNLMEKQDYEIYLATLRERNRIAREIHDNVGHMLSRSILQMGALITIHKEEPLHGQLAGVGETLNQAMNSIRESVHDLHDESIDLRQSIAEATREMKEHYQLTVDYDMSPEIPRNVKYCFITAVKEAMSNIAKHSDADKISVILREHPAFYQMTVEDNGTVGRKGQSGPLWEEEVVRMDGKEGIGLSNMKERVQALGGTFRIHTEKGFVIFISIPKRDKM